MTEIVPVLSTCTVEWMYVKFPPDFTNDPWFTNRSTTEPWPSGGPHDVPVGQCRRATVDDLAALFDREQGTVEHEMFGVVDPEHRRSTH